MARRPRLYVHPDQLVTGAVALGADEAHHAASVLRLRAGDGVELFDGQGRVALASLEMLGKRSGTALAEPAEEIEADVPSLILATAIPKGKRWQMLVEKATELGVSEIQPVLFEHSVAEGQGDPAKWIRWAIEACKQSRRAWLPAIARPIPLSAFLERPIPGPCLFTALDGDPVWKWGGQAARAEAVTLVVGPEAGLTEAETRACYDASYAPLTLGPHILRIETAALAGVALIRGLGMQEIPG